MWIMILFFVSIAVFLGVLILGLILILKALTEERNPDKCYVFPYYENTLNKPIKGIKIQNGKNGIKYQYKKRTINVPNSYPKIWHKKRITFFVDGNYQLVTDFDKNFKQNVSGIDDLEFELGTSNLVTQAIKAMKGGNDIGILVVFLVVFIIGSAIGYGVGKMTSQQPIRYVTTNVTVTTTMPSATTTILPPVQFPK